MSEGVKNSLGGSEGFLLRNSRSPSSAFGTFSLLRRGGRISIEKTAHFVARLLEIAVT